MLSSVLISDSARLRALRQPWEDLVARSADNEPTLDPCWMLPWWDIFGSEGNRELRSLAFYDGNRLVVLRPFCHVVTSPGPASRSAGWR